MESKILTNSVGRFSKYRIVFDYGVNIKMLKKALKRIGRQLFPAILITIISADLVFAQNEDFYFKKGLTQLKIAESLKTPAEARKKYQESAANFEKAIELNPEEAKFYLYRGKCFYKTEEIEKAVWDFNSAIKLNPDFAEAYLERGKIFADSQLDDEDREETFKRGLSDFAKAIELNSENADFYSVRGQALFSELTENGDESENKLALKDFNKAISLNANLIDALVFRANIFHHFSEYEKAIADSSKAIKLSPRNADAFQIRAKTYKALHEYDLAIADLTNAIKLEPKNPDLYFFRGLIYSRVGRLAEAKSDKLQEAKLLKIIKDKLPEFRKQVFYGLSKKNLDETSLINDMQ